MKKIFLLVFCLALIPVTGLAQGFTNADLERMYGPGSSGRQDSQGKHTSGAGGGEFCTVIDFNSYDETAQRTTPAVVTSRQQHDGDTSYGTGIASGGNTIKFKTATYASVTIRNNTDRDRRISVRDVKAYTIKGNVSTPLNDKTEYISPGQTVTITGIKFNPLSQIDSIKVTCF